MPFGIQPIHIVIVVIVALIIFGPKRLPDIGRWVGRSVSEFRKGSLEMTSALRDEFNKTQGEEKDYTIARPSPSQSIPTDSKFCTKCGSPNPSDAHFCSRCGTPFQA